MDKNGFVLAGFAVLFFVAAFVYTTEDKELAHSLAALSWGLLLLGITISLFESRKEKEKHR